MLHSELAEWSLFWLHPCNEQSEFRHLWFPLALFLLKKILPGLAAIYLHFNNTAVEEKGTCLTPLRTCKWDAFTSLMWQVFKQAYWTAGFQYLAQAHFKRTVIDAGVETTSHRLVVECFLWSKFTIMWKKTENILPNLKFIPDLKNYSHSRGISVRLIYDLCFRQQSQQ